MSENKTLGQVYDEAYDSVDGTSVDNIAAGIAAVAEVVARRVLAEREPAKPEAEFHDAGTITGGAAGTPAAKPEAGDWAMDAANWAVTLYETTGIVTASEIASRIREAAERQYGPIINEMKEQLASLHQALNHQTSTVVDMTKERDAALADVERLKAESPSPIDLEKFRKHLHETYSGGHHHDGHYEAFHHGMDTVCNVLVSGHSVYRQPLVAPQPAADAILAAFRATKGKEQADA